MYKSSLITLEITWYEGWFLEGEGNLVKEPRQVDSSSQNGKKEFLISEFSDYSFFRRRQQGFGEIYDMARTKFYVMMYQYSRQTP